MKLIIGLGNPEDRYTGTRHNIGFAVLMAYAKEKGAHFTPKDKFKSQVAELKIGDEKIILALPMTYYNLSGEAAHTIADFYKISPEDTLVIHDELALPFGTIRTRLGGSDAGNNGVKSISQHLGPSTARIRIGVYNGLRDKIDDADFVLGKFTREESEKLSGINKKAFDLIDSFMAGDLETTTHR